MRERREGRDDDAGQQEGASSKPAWQPDSQAYHSTAQHDGKAHVVHVGQLEAWYRGDPPAAPCELERLEVLPLLLLVVVPHQRGGRVCLDKAVHCDVMRCAAGAVECGRAVLSRVGLEQGGVVSVTPARSLGAWPGRGAAGKLTRLRWKDGRSLRRSSTPD